MAKQTVLEKIDVGSDALGRLLAQADNETALNLLQDVLNAMEDGVVLLDENLKFVLWNERYEQLTLAEGTSIIEPGVDALETGESIFAAGLFMPPEDMSSNELIEQLGDKIRTYGVDIELQRADGIFIHISSKKTVLGGYLITLRDITDRKRVDTAEQERWNILNDVVESLEEGFSLWDSDFRLLMCNDQYMEILAPFRDKPFGVGSSAETVLAEAYQSGIYVIPDEITEEMYVQHWMKWARAKAGPIELHFKDGRTVIVSAKNSELGGVLLTVIDVTAQKHAEEARLNANHLLRDAFEAMDEGIMLYDKNLRLELLNDRVKDLFPEGNKSFELGKTFYEIWDHSVKSGSLSGLEGFEIEDRMQFAETKVRASAKDIKLKTSDGRILLASSHKTEQDGYLLTFKDITNQVKAEQLLLDAIENLPSGVAVETPDGRITHSNEAFRRFYGLGVKDLSKLEREERISGLIERLEEVNSVRYEDIPPEIRRQMIEDHIVGSIPMELKFKDGRHVFAERAKIQNDVTILVFTDITKLKQEEDNRLSAINDVIEATAEALVLYDRDAKYVLSNSAYSDMFGSDPEPGEDFETVFRRRLKMGAYNLPEGRLEDEFCEHVLENFYNRNGKNNVEIQTSDGRIIYASSHKTRLDGYLVSLRDVTEDRKTEERKMEAVNEALDAIDDPLALFTSERAFVLANKAWRGMVKGYADPQPGDTVDSILQSGLEAGFYKIPDGLTEEQFLEVGLAAMDNFATDFPLTLHDGTLHLANSRKTELGGFLLSYKDVTEQRKAEAELEQQREISNQNEKLSALGELLAGVAHELNNPLSVVFGYSQMLRGKVDDPVISKRIDMIEQNAERSAKIVKTFLAMARQRPTKIEVCSLNEAVVTAIEVSSYGLKANGTQLVTDLKNDIPMIAGDYDQLAQVFTNLIVNAGHALEQQRDKGILTIRSFYDENSDHVVVEVKDNGPGIPKDIQKRIFEPFFTTKEVGKGTGVGLAFSHRIVNSHSGILELRSTPKKGTSFFVKLRSAKTEDLKVITDTHIANTMAGKRILVLDDEESVANLVSDILSEEGFVVTVKTDPKDALHILEKTEFDAVISDFKMPGMNGEQFYNAVKIIAPERITQIGFMTGDSMSKNVSTFFTKSTRPHIEKPIIANELITLVNQLCGDK